MLLSDSEAQTNHHAYHLDQQTHIQLPEYVCGDFVADPGLFFFHFLYLFLVLCGGRICSDIRIEPCGAEFSRFAQQTADRGKERERGGARYRWSVTPWGRRKLLGCAGDEHEAAAVRKLI